MFVRHTTIRRGTVRSASIGIAALAFALAACSSGQGSTSTVDTVTPPPVSGGFVAPRTVPEGMGSGQSDGEFPRTVVHFAGETVIGAQPERVVVISTGQADALLSLGVVPAASTRGDGADLIPRYLIDAYPQYATELAAVVDAGGRFEPNFEAIANLQPDLILMNTAGKDADAMYSRLSAIAPTVATQGTGMYWKQDFLLAADALGRFDQASAMLDEFNSDATELGETLESVPTVSFTRMNGDRMRVFGVPSFTGSIAQDAGLARPESQEFDETSRDISAEELTLADADRIFYGVQDGDASALTGAPLWSGLQAVQAGRAVQVDDDVFYLNTGPTAARQVLDVLEDTLQQG